MTSPSPLVDAAQAFMVRVNAARLGCAQCSNPVRVPPAGDPFSGGPWRGRYLCAQCWVLYWDDHPEHLADVETRLYVAEESRQIRLKRIAEKAQLVFEQAGSRVFLTPRGTLFFDIRPTGGHGLEEYDPERFKALARAVLGVNGKVPGYELAPSAAAAVSA